MCTNSKGVKQQNLLIFGIDSPNQYVDNTKVVYRLRYAKTDNYHRLIKYIELDYTTVLKVDRGENICKHTLANRRKKKRKYG